MELKALLNLKHKETMIKISWNYVIAYAVPFAFILILIAVANLPMVQEVPNLSKAITLDLVFTVPFIYFLFIRKKSIPKFTIVPFFIAGIVIATIVLPTNQQQLLSQIKYWVLPVVEMGVFALVFMKVRKTVKSFRSQKDRSVDFFTAIKSAAREVVPNRLSTAVAMEIAVIYYSLFAWRKRRTLENEFTYHKDGGARLLLGVFIFLILIETFAIHLLIQGASVTAAWVLSLLSGYTILQLLGILKSLSRRPTRIENDLLDLRYGLFGETSIPIDKIESFELSSKSLEFGGTTQHISPLKSADTHNIILELKEEHELIGLYGFKKPFKKLAFHIDEKEKFKQLLESKIANDI